MKLTAFEKNIFDAKAVQPPTVSTGDASPSDINLIKQNPAVAYNSSPSKPIIRQIDIPAEVVKLFTDGARFKGSFKWTKITSGEPEIIHNTEQPAVTKQIDVALRATADLSPLPEQEQADERAGLPQAQLNFESQIYRPKIDIRLNRYLIEPVGETELSFVNSEQDLRNFLRNHGYLSQNKYYSRLNGDTVSDLANTILGNGFPQEQTLLAGRQFRYYKLIRNRSGKPILNELILINFTTTERMNHDYTIKEPVLDRSGLIIPFREERTVDLLNKTFGSQAINQPTIYGTKPPPPTVKAKCPIDIKTGDISIETGYETTVERIPFTYDAFLDAQSSVRAITSIDFDSRSATGFNLRYVRAYNNPSSIQRWRRETKLYVSIRLNTRFNDFLIGVFEGSMSENLRKLMGGHQAAIRPNTAALNGPILRVLIGTKTMDSTQSRRPPGSNLFSSSEIQSELASSDLTGSKLAGLATIISQNALNAVGGKFWESQEDTDLQRQAVLNMIPFKQPSGQSITNQAFGIIASSPSISVNGVNFPISFRSYDIGKHDEQSYDRYVRINRSSINWRALPLQTDDPEFPQATFNISDELSYRLIGRQDDSLLFDKVDTRQRRKRNADDTTGVPIRNRNIINSQDDFSSLEFVFSALKRQTAGNRLRNVSGGFSNPRPVLPAYPNAQRFSLGGLAEQFDPRFPTRVQHILDSNRLWTVPDLSQWLAYGGDIPTQSFSVEVFIKDPPLEFIQDDTEEEEDTTVDLLKSVDTGWPWVSITGLRYDTDNKRIMLALSRSKSAPIPPKPFFDAISIAGRRFNSSSARFSQDLDVRSATWNWPASLDFLRNRRSVPIEIIKSGSSRTNRVNDSRVVTKSTVQTNEYKDLPSVLGGFMVKDIVFDSNSLKIVFNGLLTANSFSALAVYSADGSARITRDLSPNDAVIANDNDAGTTSFTWSAYAEFGSILRNKSYQLEMIKGAVNSENKIFIPRPDKIHWHWPLVNQTETGLEIDWQLSTPDESELDFISIGLFKANGDNVLNWQSKDRWKQTKQNRTIKTEYVGNVASIALGDDLKLSLQIKERHEFSFNIIRTTDILFDTIILFNTNLQDIFLQDSLQNDLLHPSDIDSIISVEEQRIKHLIINLKTDIASRQVTIINRKLIKYDYRKIGQVLLLKKIGVFSQFPNIQVSSFRSREVSIDQHNLSHIKGRPNSINYNMIFPGVLKEEDLLLAQNLYSRVADFNEFLIWVSGGDVAPKHTGMRGFRVIDIIKGLVANEFDFRYVDGRFTSAINFEMQVNQVS